MYLNSIVYYSDVLPAIKDKLLLPKVKALDKTWWVEALESYRAHRYIVH